MPDDTATADLLDAVSMSHLLHRAQQLAEDRFTFLAGEAGITFRQYVLLAELSSQSGRTQVDLTRATGIDRSTMTEMISRLEERRLIARMPSPTDARAKTVEITDSGHAMLSDMRQHARAAEAAILDRLSKPDGKKLRAILLALMEEVEEEARKLEQEAKKKAKREAKKARALRKAEAAKAEKTKIKAEKAEKPEAKTRRKNRVKAN